MKECFHILKITITALAVICFFASCEDNLKEVQKMEISSNEPVGEVENMLLKHTDSGKLKLILKGKKMLDFSNDAYPYTNFPEGIEVEVLEHRDSLIEKTVITADTGTMYDITKIVDLRGNVVIITSDGNTFKGEQLYWDQTSKWIFTNKKFEAQILNAKNGQNLGVITGTAWDANENLKQSIARDSDDIIIPQQTTLEDE